MTQAVERPLVTTWVDKYVRGWDGQGVPPGWHPSPPFLDAMQVEYASDAHFVPYYGTADKDGQRKVLTSLMRVTLQSLPALRANGGELWFGYGVADVDCPEAHKGGGTPEEWREQMRALAEQHVSGCCHWDSRRGMRIVWAWPEPLKPEQYSEKIAKATAYLRSVGIPADDLKDWGRCHRVPYGTRDGVLQQLSATLREPAVWSPPENVSEAGSVWDGIDRAADTFQLPDQIGAGERHTVLKSYAASLRAKGLGRDAITGALHEADLTRGDPPLLSEPQGESEIDGIVDWVCKLPAGPSKVGVSPLGKSAKPARSVQTAAIPPISFPADAYEYVFRRGDASEVAEWALHYIEEGAGNVRCVYDKGAQWRYVPTRGVFVKIEPDDLYPLILSAAGMKVLSKMTAEGPKYVPLKLGSQHVTDAVRCMGMARFRRKFFSDNIPGIAFTDCFVRVTANGIEKHPHSPDWACNISYDFPWTDDPPVEWLTFLDEVWALHDVTDRGREVQSLGEWLGASLAGFVSLYQKALLMQGGGSNGKSQTAIVVEGCFPEGSVTHFAPQHLASEYNRARLATARLNIVTEVPESEITDVAASVTKSLVAGEPMSGRHIRETPFDFTPACGVLLVVNGLPPVRDYSHGWRRRWLGFQFDREFTEGEAKRDYGKHLLEAERDRIVCWGLRLSVDLLARGHYEETEASKQLIEDWQRASDEIADWLSEATSPAPSGQGTDCPTLYTAFLVWCETAGITSRPTRRQFFDRLRTKVKRTFGGPSSNRYAMYPIVLTNAVAMH